MTPTISDPSFIEARGRRFPRRSSRQLGLAEQFVVALLAVAMLLGGCSASSGAPRESSVTPSIAPASPTFVSSAAPNEFPVALGDDEGTAGTVPGEARRGGAPA